MVIFTYFMHDLCKKNIVLYLGLSIYISIAYDMVIRWSRFSVLHIYKIFIGRAYIAICLHNIFTYILCSVHAYIVFKDEQSAHTALSHNMALVSLPVIQLVETMTSS